METNYDGLRVTSSAGLDNVVMFNLIHTQSDPRNGKEGAGPGIRRGGGGGGGGARFIKLTKLQ